MLVTTEEKFEILRDWIREDEVFAEAIHNQITITNKEVIEKMNLIASSELAEKQASAVMAELTK